MLVLLLLVFAGCGVLLPPEDASLEASESLLKGVSIIEETEYHVISGTVGGADFIIYIPAASASSPAWNGRLILYAHGYVSPQIEELAIPEEFDVFKGPLMAMGYAVGCSTYSENGWAVKDGIIRTRQLLSLFTRHYTAPEKTYLAGASEGGIISVRLAEKNPELFDGVLVLCGPAGGTDLQLRYLYHMRALFQYFFEKETPVLPVAPGSTSILEVPTGLDYYTQIAPLILQAVTAPGADLKLVLMADVMTNLGFPILPEELPETLIAALWFYFEGINDFFDRTHDHVMIDNQETEYQISEGLFLTLPEPLQIFYSDLNQWVERVSSTPDAAKYLEHWYVPSGKLETKLLMLHTSRDPVVPKVHMDVYREIVLAAGNGENLYQRTLEGFGHCMLKDDPTNLQFNLAVITAFTDLAAWVEYGVFPQD
jgi:pimeloyl-ACP methyl ester carboxylesterase